MQGKERSAVLSLAAIMAFRMLGLFMILPVFSIYAEKIPGATAVLVGLALGIYGLTQACLQMPFGALSDRVGRKPIIITGLLLFALGSVIAALSHSIYGVIIGRAVQGAGAIGSTTLAFVADLTHDEQRSKAMALMGLTIGLAFSVAIVLGPIINTWFHLSGIFWVTAGLAVIGIVILLGVPTPPKMSTLRSVSTNEASLRKILSHPQLLRLDIGIFSLHAMLTALFIGIPILLTHILGLSEGQQILLYLVVLALAFMTMVPLIIIAEKKRKMKAIFIGAIVTLTLAQLSLLSFHQSAFIISVMLFIFFAAFTLLEASLPSLVSKISPIRNKGAAMGVYSTAQFLGIFIGGSVGGLTFAHFGIDGLFMFGAILGLVWFLIAFTMAQPPYLSTLIFTQPNNATQVQIDELGRKLRSIPGVAEVAIMLEEQLIYLKVDKQLVKENELRNVVGTGNL